MRLIRVFFALAFMAGCATAPVAQAPSPTLSAGSTGRAAALLRQAGGSDAPTPQEVTRAIGEADIVRQDGVGLAMTYRLESCALLLLFAADGRNVMRLDDVHASARRGGSGAPSLEQCALEAETRRS